MLRKKEAQGFMSVWSGFQSNYLRNIMVDEGGGRVRREKKWKEKPRKRGENDPKMMKTLRERDGRKKGLARSPSFEHL